MRGEWQTDRSISVGLSFLRRYKLLLLAVSLIIIVSIIVIFSIDWISHRKIYNIKIEGNEFIPQEIFKNLVPDTLYKREKGNVRLKEIRQLVLKYPFVRNVNVSFGSNDDVVLELTLRKPVAQLVDSAGRLMFVDEERNILPYLFFENFSYLPVLRTTNNDRSIDSADLDFLINMLLMLRQEKYALVYGQISELISDSKSNTYSARLTGNIAKIEFGDSGKIGIKLDNLLSFLVYYYQHENKSKVEYIDLRWSRQVIVKSN